LMGKVTSLNKFVSTVKDKCLSFFKVLKKALMKLKDYLAQPPLLSLTVIGEKLYHYLVVSNIAVSSTLIKEEKEV